MTINNNSLSNKLNQYKNKKNISENNDSSSSKSEDEEFLTTEDTSTSNIFYSLITLFNMVIKPVVFGYGLKIILNQDWNFFAWVSIGLAIKYILDFIEDLIYSIKS